MQKEFTSQVKNPSKRHSSRRRMGPSEHAECAVTSNSNQNSTIASQNNKIKKASEDALFKKPMRHNALCCIKSVLKKEVKFCFCRTYLKSYGFKSEEITRHQIELYALYNSFKSYDANPDIMIQKLLERCLENKKSMKYLLETLKKILKVCQNIKEKVVKVDLSNCGIKQIIAARHCHVKLEKIDPSSLIKTKLSSKTIGRVKDYLNIENLGETGNMTEAVEKNINDDCEDKGTNSCLLKRINNNSDMKIDISAKNIADLTSAKQSIIYEKNFVINSTSVQTDYENSIEETFDLADMETDQRRNIDEDTNLFRATCEEKDNEKRSINKTIDTTNEKPDLKKKTNDEAINLFRDACEETTFDIDHKKRSINETIYTTCKEMDLQKRNIDEDITSFKNTCEETNFETEMKLHKSSANEAISSFRDTCKETTLDTDHEKRSISVTLDTTIKETEKKKERKALSNTPNIEVDLKRSNKEVVDLSKSNVETHSKKQVPENRTKGTIFDSNVPKNEDILSDVNKYGQLNVVVGEGANLSNATEKDFKGENSLLVDIQSMNSFRDSCKETALEIEYEKRRTKLTIDTTCKEMDLQKHNINKDITAFTNVRKRNDEEATNLLIVSKTETHSKKRKKLKVIDVSSRSRLKKLSKKRNVKLDLNKRNKKELINLSSTSNIKTGSKKSLEEDIDLLISSTIETGSKKCDVKIDFNKRKEREVTDLSNTSIKTYYKKGSNKEDSFEENRSEKDMTNLGEEDIFNSYDLFWDDDFDFSDLQVPEHFQSTGLFDPLDPLMITNAVQNSEKNN